MPTRNTNYTNLYLNRQTTNPQLSTGMISPINWFSAARNAPPQTDFDPSFATDPFRGPIGEQPPIAPGETQLPFVEDRLEQIRLNARTEELARLSDFREMQRQFTQRQGASSYEQAMMAMEQQRALSDTRGLTAGAREGAEQRLSATQQVALNQIQNATMDQILQIDAASIQDAQVADEYGMRALQAFKATNPDFVAYEAATNNLNVAYNSNDPAKIEAAERAFFEAQSRALGIPLDSSIYEGVIDTSSAASAANSIRQTTMSELQRLSTPASGGQVATQASLSAGSALAAVATVAKGASKSLAVAAQTAAAGTAATAAGQTTITFSAVKGITNTAQLTSIAKALGATTAEVTKANTAASLQSLIAKKMGAKTAVKVATSSLGKTAAAVTAKAGLGTKAVAVAAKGLAAIGPVGWVVGAALLTGAAIYFGVQAYRSAQTMDIEGSAQVSRQLLNDEKVNLIRQGFSEQEAESAVRLIESPLPPIYQRVQ